MCSIHIGNLHYDTNKADLDYEFKRYGRINSMWIARSPPGFAFIEFDDARDAEDAIRDMDGREILGRRVQVGMKKEGGNGRGRGSDGRERSRTDDATSVRGKPTRSEHRILISGLEDGLNWKDLKNLLQEKTDPVYVDLRGDGKAVAEFSSADDIAVSIEAFDGLDFKGGKIQIVKDEKGGDERSESWQKFDTRPSTKRYQAALRERELAGGRDRGRGRDAGRSRSRDYRRGGGGYSRSQSRDRSRARYRDHDRNGDDRRHQRRGVGDRSRSRDKYERR